MIEIGSYAHANELLSACEELCAAKALVAVMKMLLRQAATRDWHIRDALVKQMNYDASLDDLAGDLEDICTTAKAAAVEYLARREKGGAHV